MDTRIGIGHSLIVSDCKSSAESGEIDAHWRSAKHKLVHMDTILSVDLGVVVKMVVVVVEMVMVVVVAVVCVCVVCVCVGGGGGELTLYVSPRSAQPPSSTGDSVTMSNVDSSHVLRDRGVDASTVSGWVTSPWCTATRVSDPYLSMNYFECWKFSVRTQLGC
jgi:hypothetical protein